MKNRKKFRFLAWLMAASMAAAFPSDPAVTAFAAGSANGLELRQQIEAVQAVSEPLQEAYDALTLVDMDDVRGNLPLFKEGANGVSIDWTSSNPAVISDAADGLYDGGIVTRPAAGKAAEKVTLKAKLTLNQESVEKVFQVTVTPQEANPDRDYSAGYL